VRDPAVAGPLGSLALSQVRPLASALALRARRWHEGLERLGVVLPFVLVHDLGLVFAAPREQYDLGPRVEARALGPAGADALRFGAAYHDLLVEVAGGEVARRAAQLKMNDDLVVVVLARLLGTIAARLGAGPAYASGIPADASIFDQLDPQLPALFGAVRKREFELAAFGALEAGRLFVLTMADALDLDTLRLFGMLGAEASAGALAQVDLLAALESPEANDIVNFSLEILPSVLETKTRAAAGTTASFGYAGIGTRGSIDSMVLSELAWDDLELARRIAENEVLYFAREQSREEQRRVHLLLVDASASMRGDRQTFARGLAIATAKKLLLEGEDVAFRFFDARLYETIRAKNGEVPTAAILAFKGERGRNPARVFAQLATELDIARQRDPRQVVVHLFTHAALYIPREMVQAVQSLAHLAAVFILPSGGGTLDLDYLDLLDAHWVVDHATLAHKTARADAAKSILGETEGALPPADGDGPRSMRGPASARAPASLRGGAS
jgi:hypothetical protein